MISGSISTPRLDRSEDLKSICTEASLCLLPLLGMIPARIAHVEKQAGRNRLSERVSHICP
jgi:hypothetical protein